MASISTSRVCVVTSNGRGYYAIVSRLRKAGVSFLSLLPGGEHPECGLILTTREEAALYDGRSMVLDELGENPDVLKGKIVSRLSGGKDILLVGVDPGTRIGMAAFLGDARIALRTFDSRQGLCSAIVEIVTGIPTKKTVVRIGNGNPGLAAGMATMLSDALPRTPIEIVDEAGTSVRGVGMRGVQVDQGAAAKIALRRGVMFGHPRSSRSPR